MEDGPPDRPVNVDISGPSIPVLTGLEKATIHSAEGWWRATLLPRWLTHLTGLREVLPPSRAYGHLGLPHVRVD